VVLGAVRLPFETTVAEESESKGRIESTQNNRSLTLLQAR